MENLVNIIINELKSIQSIKAIVLGGSYATGTQHEKSDIDLGIYYEESDLLDINAIKQIANKFNDFENPHVANLGEWGKWVNGGAWLTIKNQRVDFIYRNLNFVEKIISESKKGYIEVDYYQQPAFGFFSYIYCGETKFCKTLYDPKERLEKLKQQINVYPIELKKAIYRKFLWDAEFSFLSAKKALDRNDLIVFAGCITRIINDLIQVLYALNETFFINEKQYKNDISKFTLKPKLFFEEIENTLGNIKTKSPEKLHILIEEIKLLTKEFYQSPFTLP